MCCIHSKSKTNKSELETSLAINFHERSRASFFRFNHQALFSVKPLFLITVTPTFAWDTDFLPYSLPTSPPPPPPHTHTHTHLLPLMLENAKKKNISKLRRTNDQTMRQYYRGKINYRCTSNNTQPVSAGYVSVRYMLKLWKH